MTHRPGHWVEVADRTFARRYAELDQTLGLVVGDEHCLVIDTGSDERFGAELAAAVREITALPWTVMITHAHFDHFFGTRAFLPCPVWAHARCRDVLADTAEQTRRDWAERYRGEGKADLAVLLEAAELVLPTGVFTQSIELDLGGRAAVLLHPGPAHTDHDVAVHVPDVGVLFAGDLVEQGAPPSVGSDAHLARWPDALDRLLELGPGTIVPGHGDPVDPEFVTRQRDALRERHAAGDPGR
ncbi:Glyoxylase, beta-lactamase superfamily II [Amycolatopsis marina]|uniref:Glyoxylase, beta-lactamase superfamily II n=1 Tax=Amycolatopsis marina TaxID=490629 RepID=A0A1I0ZL58_9PSEU|nr:MBL fold metallo-hydrolase [Amycolatopsis marina]SFB26519.1 Glyoxylase, beta-lactamase superfamily II [Amycolatopsis marina]